MVAFDASRHMPPSASVRQASIAPYGSMLRMRLTGKGHHLELGQTNMPRIGPPPHGAMLAENVRNLQLGMRQLPVRLHQPSPECLIL
jgi:hypothetical protein